MDATARRVQAERARRRLPPRLRRGRAGVRLAGLLGTAALVGVAIAIAVMVTPDRDTEGAPAVAAPAITPTPTAARHVKRGPTRAQLAQRRKAIAELRRQGYSPINKDEYDFHATLRVLIGERTGGTGRYAFFFAHGRYLGHDALSPSARLNLASSGKRTVTLVYRTYAVGDSICCPQGPHVKVRFRWDGTRVLPLDAIPASSVRLVYGTA